MFTSPKELQHGSGATMDLEPQYALLQLARSPADPEGIVQRLLRERVRIVDHASSILASSEDARYEINDSDTRYWLRRDAEGIISDDFRTTIEEGIASVAPEPPRFVGPVYRIRGTTGLQGLLCPAPDVLLIERAPAVAGNEADFDNAIRGLNLVEDTYRSSLLPGFRYYRLESLDGISAYDLRERILLEMADWVTSVRFENIPLVSPLLALPNDTAFVDQWNMVRVRAGGQGLTGWDICTGKPDVIVAIIDSGFDTTHRDLSFIHLGIDITTNQPTAHDTTKRHGTQVAGIACAVYNNAFGVAGMAGNCRILPIRISNSDVEVAAGITYAANEGALVINLSIGQNDNGTWDFNIIDPSIANAHAKGCVLCAAAGNDDIASICYPARHALVMACAATDENDERLSGHNGGSNFGFKVHLGVRTGISVAAPGIAIPTTIPHDAIGNMGMTSAAAPHVSGLAALLISHCGRTNDEVRQIIESSADKRGGVSYALDPDFPNGSHSSELGYGLINVLNALQACVP